MDEIKTRETFRLLHPICVSLAKEHTIERVKSLLQCIENLKPDQLQPLQEYVLYPLRLILKQSSTRDVKLYEEVVLCMGSVINRTEVGSSQMFLDIFNSLCLLLTTTTTAVKVSVANLSEELKINVTNTLSSLVKSTTFSVLTEVYKPCFLPPLGHAITLLLHMAENEGSRQLRVATVTCLMDLALISRKKVPSDLTTTLSQLFASFLPGLSISLCRLIAGDTKQGYKITTVAIEAWYKMVTLVLKDQTQMATNDLADTSDKSRKPGDKYASLVVNKSDDWVKSTANNLCVLTQKIKEVKSHSNWRVRLAMVDWASHLLTNCSHNLESSVPDFLEVLVGLVSDEYSNVRKLSQVSLQQLSKSSGFLTRTLTELLEDNLHTLATQLPRLVRTSDEESKLSTMRLFNGYIRLLGCNVNSLLNSAAHLQRVSLALLQVLELDCAAVNGIQEKAAGDSFASLESGVLFSYPRKNFKYFTDNAVYSELVTTCQLLGCYGDPEILLDHFLDLFDQYKLHRKQVALAINHICQGFIHTETQPRFQCEKENLHLLISSVLKLYLCREHFDLDIVRPPPGENTQLQMVLPRTTSTLPTLQEMNSNVLQTCIILEGISICVEILGKDKEYVLMDVLYPVLEKIGSENTAISQTACITLTNLGHTLHYSGKEELLKANADYLVNAISLRMRHLSRNPRAPQVLNVILQHGDKEILPLVEDSISEILDGLDSNYEDVGLVFMRVLHTLTRCICKWYQELPPAQEGKVSDESDKDSPNMHNRENTVNTAQEVTDFILKHLHHKSVAHTDLNDIDTSDHEDGSNENEAVNEDISDSSERQVPYHIQKLTQVLERCIHMMCSADTHVRLLTLDTVSQALQALEHHQNDLLPLVHKLWSPFIQRLIDKEMVVIIKACDTLQTFAKVSRDFIRQRVVKDVFQKLISFLQKQAGVSLKAGPVYHHSMACKLQQHILRQVGELCHLVAVGETDLLRVMNTCVPYLSARQPKVLQTACVWTFEQFCLVDADCVWLVLNRVYCPVPPVTPCSKFPDINFTATERNEFSENVTEILKNV